MQIKEDSEEYEGEKKSKVDEPVVEEEAQKQISVENTDGNQNEGQLEQVDEGEGFTEV